MFFFSFPFFHLFGSSLCAFRGALTTAFLLETRLKGSPQVSSDHLPWLLFVGVTVTSRAAKDGRFSTGTNFSFQIINHIQTLCRERTFKKPRENHIPWKGTEKSREKKNLIKDKMFSLGCFVLVDSISNFYLISEVLIFLTILFIFTSRWTM